MTTQERHWILGGGLASGKSSVRRFLADAGVATIDADSVGHAVLEPDGAAFEAVARRWPKVVQERRIDRQALADVVFYDAEELAVLEGITHPHIFDTIRKQVEKIRGPVVVELPVTPIALGNDWRLIVVDSRQEDKLRRALDRGMEEVDALARFGSQPSRQEWLAAADVVIPNHSSMEDLEEAVETVVTLL